MQPRKSARPHREILSPAVGRIRKDTPTRLCAHVCAKETRMSEPAAGTPGTDDTIDLDALATQSTTWERLTMPKGFARGVVETPFKELKGRALTLRLALQQLVAHGNNRQLLEVLDELSRAKHGHKDFTPFERCARAESAWRAEDVEAWHALKELADLIKVPVITMTVTETVVGHKDGKDVTRKVYSLPQTTPITAFKRIAQELEADPFLASQATDLIAKAKARKAHLALWTPEVGLTDDVDYRQRFTRAKLLFGGNFGRLKACDKVTRDIAEAIVEASGRKPRRILLAARRLAPNRQEDQEALLKVLDIIMVQEAEHSRSDDVRAKHGILVKIAERLSTKEKPIHAQQFVGDDYEELDVAAKRLVILAGIDKREVIRNAKPAIEAQLLAAKLSEPPKEENEGEGQPTGS